MAEQVDAGDLKSPGQSRAGSSPARRTNTKTFKVWSLRNRGFTYQEIFIITGIQPRTAMALLSNFKRSVKVREYARKYREANRADIREQWNKWAKKNRKPRTRDISRETYLRKCREAGVQPL